MIDRLERRLPATAAEINEGIARGWQRGVAVSVSREQSLVAEGAIGTSHDDVPLTGETLLPWLSAGKPLTAVCLLQQIEAGRLSLDTPVSQVIPEFRATTPETTVLHLLTHTAGLADVETGWPQAPWNTIIHRICAAGLRHDWVPGERAAYDPQRGWFLLGEMIHRLTGRPVATAVRDDLLLPLGMTDSWLAMPATVHHDYGERIGRAYEIRGPRAELTQGHRLPFCTAASPGSSARGPIGELRKFYEMLLNGGTDPQGRQLLQTSSVELMTRRHRVGMYDETFRHTLDFGLGVIINSAHYGPDTVPYGYGQRAGEDAFGHGGARSCIAFADPQHQVVVAIVANGYLPEPRHQERMRRLLAAVYDDLQVHDDSTASASPREQNE